MAKRLLAAGLVYETEESPAALVFRIPRDRAPKVTVEDPINGALSWSTFKLQDFVILRKDGTATYNFSGAVDDMLMRITDVIRGREHLVNTIRQVLLLEALLTVNTAQPVNTGVKSSSFGYGQSYQIPRYSHCSLLVDSQHKAKLSKRTATTSRVDVGFYRTEGFLPEAIRNYLAVVGWSHEPERELYNTDELVDLLRLAQLSSSAIVFDVRKLQWFNKQYVLKQDYRASQKRLEDLVQTALLDPHFGDFQMSIVSFRLFQQYLKTCHYLGDDALAIPEFPQTHSTLSLSSTQRRRLLSAAMPLFSAQTTSAVETASSSSSGKKRRRGRRSSSAGERGENLYLCGVTDALQSVFGYPLPLTLSLRPRTQKLQTVVGQRFREVAETLLANYRSMPSSPCLARSPDAFMDWVRVTFRHHMTTGGQKGFSQDVLPSVRLALTGDLTGPSIAATMLAVQTADGLLSGTMGIDARMHMLRHMITTKSLL